MADQIQPKPLRIVGARDNNLKNISLEIPHDSLVVLTGLSGSGKSSLAFDTVYAEGQRRYIETFSPYTRQFFDKVKKPDVDLIDNVRPAIAIQQRTRVTGSRSTVGSMTNVNDYLKILWSNIATPVCPTCEIELERWTSSALAAHLIKLQAIKPRATLYLCAALKVTSVVHAEQELTRLSTFGFSRVLDESTGEVIQGTEFLARLAPQCRQIIVVLDRFKGASLPAKRLADSIEQAFTLGSGRAIVISPEQPTRKLLAVLQCGPETTQANQLPLPYERWDFNNQFSCPRGTLALLKPRPALFSFNSPLGACPECRGFGKVLVVDPKLCVPDERLTLAEHALQCWTGNGARAEFKRLLKFCEARKISIDTPWRELEREDRELIFNYKGRDFRGVRAWFKHLERKAYKMHVRVFLARYRMQIDCPVCEGTRLRRDALAYRIAGKTLATAWTMPVDQLHAWLLEVRGDLQSRNALARQLKDVFEAVLTRLQYMLDLGLPYLNLDRQTRTLSGGETQRVNLAAALGSELISTHFVLDEPSVGLHARDTDRLIAAVRGLQARGNSVLLVEHDLDCIAEADHIIEMGPESGSTGGEVTFQGPAAQWPGIKVPAVSAKPSNLNHGSLQITDARSRNLKGLSLSIPLGKLVGLSGVSGSGKSTLVHEVIMRAYERRRSGNIEELQHSQVSGFEQVEQVLLVDQTPLAKSPRANIATYSGIWDTVRDLLAASDEAKARGLSKSSFSFNVDGGRCPACSGAGFIREDMQFLSDVYVPCDVCLGKRFSPPVLEVTCKGFNADELLKMSVDRCAAVFQGHPKIGSAAETLAMLGLGHLRLGHSLSELSGGEAQRLKLVPFIEQSNQGSALLIFDEPTTGLHLHDVARLIELFRILVERGHSVLCVEHNLFLLSHCDWLIDLGPEGGAGGGEIVLQGSPQEFLSSSAAECSATARYLQQFKRISDAATIRAPRRKPSLKPRPKPAPRSSEPERRDHLTIVGAREHNLKDITVSVPLNQVVAITGVSGSGKSSIAKDIIYAEGQRRYLDCLSPYARQFIKELSRPELDSIHNVQPTLCIYQHTFQPSKLSTVATMSEVYNFLRLLYAKTAKQHCPEHPNEVIAPLSAPEIAQEIKTIEARSVRILAPVIKLKKGLHKPIFTRAVESEIFEVRVDGNFANPSRFEEGLEKTKAHTIEYVIAKFNPHNMALAEIEDAVTQALSLSGGTLVVHHENGEALYSVQRTCPVCKTGFFKPDPEDLSFNSKRGRCEECSGAGVDNHGETCSACEGSRLGPIGCNLRLAGKNIFEACSSGATDLLKMLAQLQLAPREQALAAPVLLELRARAATVIAYGLDYIALNRSCSTLSGGELQRLRLATATGSPLSGVMYIFDEPSVGLHPLENAKVLDQIYALKSRGNSVLMIEHDPQSIRSCDYIIDVGPGGGSNGGEIVFAGPMDNFVSAGDSPTAKALRDPPGASSNAAAERTVRELDRVEQKDGAALSMRIRVTEMNNLRKLDLTLPLNALVAVAGVSGAGKSSLVHSALVNALQNGKLRAIRGTTNEWSTSKAIVTSDLKIERILEVDQRPIGANSRSTPASYLGLWDEVRKLYANTIEAKSRGFTESYFSYNTGKGRCLECKGLGEILLEMNFLPDARVTCESCGGNRFVEESDTVRYLGLSIREALALTFDEARLKFINYPKLHRPLHAACELGLGYLTLGQSSATLSGGESQRIKLVAELSGRPKVHTLYVLDEPTTGLHRADVARLIATLHELVKLGHSVIVIEHDADVLLAANHVIELGPGSGELGGQVVFEGSPKNLIRANSPWGGVLRESLGKGLGPNGQKVLAPRDVRASF